MNSKKLKELYPFENCSEEELSQLSEGLEEISYRDGRSIYLENQPTDYVYVVLDGLVEMSKYNDFEEKEHHIGVLSHADLFGSGEMFFDEYYINTKAVGDVTLLRMKKQFFFDVLLLIPCMNRFVMKSFAHIIRQRIFMIDWHSALGKIYYYIFFLCNEYGIMKKDRILIDHKITHEKIAGILNLSREHVSRLMSQLVKENVIDKTGSDLTVSREWYDKKLADQKFSISFRRNFLFESEE